MLYNNDCCFLISISVSKQNKIQHHSGTCPDKSIDNCILNILIGRMNTTNYIQMREFVFQIAYLWSQDTPAESFALSNLPTGLKEHDGPLKSDNV